MKQFYFIILLFFFWACAKDRQISGNMESLPTIFPDYVNVTIPYNIAPLNFSVQSSGQPILALFRYGDEEFQVEGRNGEVCIPEKKWKDLLIQAKGDSIEITIAKKEQDKWIAYSPFSMYVTKEAVDPYLAYRLIDPGYSLWNKMGIFQRNLESYEETSVYENKITNYNCVNCHSFCQYNPDKMLFHMRAKMGGTVLIDEGEIEFLETKVEETISALVYPYWHPSGKYIAFSVNKTTQDLHPTQRTEVYDTASDVVVYDIEKHTILSTPLTTSRNNFETFPTFSPDGKTLFYCSAPACPMPDSIRKLSYSLCYLSFDPETGTFGNTAVTLYNACTDGKSVSFPRVSPDGKFMLCTLSAYGTFPVWHKDADLYMIDLRTKRGFYPDAVNSDDTESYHSWSSNSRWIVFSSRRMDGLYTRPFLAYVAETGVIDKPFVLPQKDTGYYDLLMKSYNIPEFITGKVDNNSFKIRKKAERGGVAVKYSRRSVPKSE